MSAENTTDDLADGDPVRARGERLAELAARLMHGERWTSTEAWEASVIVREEQRRAYGLDLPHPYDVHGPDSILAGKPRR